MKHLSVSLFTIVLILVPGYYTTAFCSDDKPVNIRWSGFVKNDFFLDSREVISGREGHFLLYPRPVEHDKLGVDVNARHSFNFLSVQSRIRAGVWGPDVWGAATTAVLEGSFFGQTDLDINGLRLRQAYIQLDWGRTQLLTGQFWHLLFVPENFAGTVSFNTGVPFQFFSRNPQVRITHSFGDSFSMAAAAATQRDFSSPGGPQTLSNSTLPDLAANVTYTNNSRWLAGITAAYKKLLPRTVTEKGYKTHNTTDGIIVNAFFRLNTSPVTFKAQGTYAQNAFDGMMLGGYAVQQIMDTATDHRKYTSVNSISSWVDIHTNGNPFQAGIFAGYTQNLGTQNPINKDILHSNDIKYGEYVRGENIRHVYRISPRIIYNIKNFRIAGEVEFTTAAYAQTDDSDKLMLNENAQIILAREVTNMRIIVATYYFF